MDVAQVLQSTHHRIPDYRLAVKEKGDSQDITQLIVGRLISLQLTDNRGFEADELEVQLSDDDGRLTLPSRGALLTVALGWKKSPLTEKGSYTVDEIQYSGTPDVLTIRARSADLRGSLSSKQERSFHKITLGALINQLAKENQLEPLCADKFKSVMLDHLDQTNESTINLLTRLAKQYDAIATVKNGKLLFIPTGQGKSATGKPLPVMQITKSVGDNYQFSITENQNYKAVKAYWYDYDTGKKGEVIIDENSKIERNRRMTKGRKLKSGKVKGQHLSKRKYNVLVQSEPITTDADQIKTLRHQYKTEANALNGAKAAFDKMKRGVATLTLNLANGNAELMPELPVNVSGFKAQIDSTDWIIAKVTHQLNDSGFTTQVELELMERGCDNLEKFRS